MLNQLATVIADKKGFNIIALDVRNVSSMSDYLLIAEGNVERHVRALANAVLEKLADQHFQVAHVEGLQTGDWIVIDAWEVMIHLFIPSLRERYQIERLWQEAEVIDLELEEHYG
ncbi:MAG: ribosome silencing factor [Verrucomicrobia bacterium]|nr:ribosome silencing factor [Verrucomicrobiota bacterium]